MSLVYTSNLGLLFIGIVITPLFSGTKNVTILDIIPGIGFGLICLSLNLFLLRRIKK